MFVLAALGSLLILLVAAFFAAALILPGCTTRSTNPCTLDAGQCYSIQGEYSALGCPGQRTETVNVNGQTFFLGCYGSQE
jgi:hypothetical protein